MAYFLKNYYIILYFTILLFIGFIVIGNGRMGIDEGIWNYMARAWVDYDIKPYTGTLDDKPPGIIILNTVSYLIFDIGFLPIRLLGLVCIILTSITIVKISELLDRKESGYFSAVVFSLSMMWDCFNGPYLGQSEIFMVFFSVVANYFLLRFLLKPCFFHLLIIGGAFGVSAVFKQVSGLILLSSFIVILVNFNWRRSLKFCFVIGSSFILIFTLLHLPMINSSNFQSYLKFAWLYPNYYETFFWRIPKFIEGFLGSKIMLFYPMLLGGLFTNLGKQEWVLKSFLISWLLFAFIGVNISGYYYGHQFTQILPILSIIAGIGAHFICRKVNLRFKKLFLLVLFLFLPYNTLMNNTASILSHAKENSLTSSLSNHLRGFSDSKRLGKWFRKNTAASDRLYFLGISTNVELFYSDRLSASRYFTEMRILGEKTEEKIVDDLISKHPKYIGIEKSIGNYNIIKKHVKKNYKLAFIKNEIKIFEIK
jgi:hypothetical protein